MQQERARQIKPVNIEATAPVVLNFFQYIVNRIVGTFAEAAIQNASETRNATFNFSAPSAKMIEKTETAIAAISCSSYLLFLCYFSFFNNFSVNIMRNC